jgi:hypothetical protein
MEEPQNRKEEMMDLDETDDQDFDMFLEEKDNGPGPSSPEALQAAFNDLAQVWSGKVRIFLRKYFHRAHSKLDQYAFGLDYPSRNPRGGPSNWRSDNRIWLSSLEDSLSLGPATDRRSRARRQVGPVFTANQDEFHQGTNSSRILPGFLRRQRWFSDFDRLSDCQRVIILNCVSPSNCSLISQSN